MKKIIIVVVLIVIVSSCGIERLGVERYSDIGEVTEIGDKEEGEELYRDIIGTLEDKVREKDSIIVKREDTIDSIKKNTTKNTPIKKENKKEKVSLSKDEVKKLVEKIDTVKNKFEEIKDKDEK